MARRVLSISVLLVSVWGCTDQPTSPTPEPERSVDKGAVLSLSRYMRTLDDELVEFGRAIPGGFGGMYWDKAGRLNVYLVDESRKEEALTALVNLQRRQVGEREASSDDFRIQKGRYEFSSLLAWYRSYLRTPESALLITGDVDDRWNRILIEVGNSEDAKRVARVLARLGVPEGASEVRITAPIIPLTSLRDRVRPVLGGIEHNSGPGPCSIGFNVDHWLYGRTVVTNSHCTSVPGQINGNIMTQPAGISPSIATEVLDPPFSSGSGCPAGRVCRYSDAALFQYHDSVSWDLGKIAKTTGLGSIQIDPLSPTFNIDSADPEQFCWFGPCPRVGWTVHKVGRTSGWTSGTVTNQCMTVNLAGSNFTQLCASRADLFAQGGDSGSPVFTVGGILGDPESATLNGILFAADLSGTPSFFSYITYVRGELSPNSSLTCQGWKASSGFWC